MKLKKEMCKEVIKNWCDVCNDAEVLKDVQTIIEVLTRGFTEDYEPLNKNEYDLAIIIHSIMILYDVDPIRLRRLRLFAEAYLQ